MCEAGCSLSSIGTPPARSPISPTRIPNTLAERDAWTIHDKQDRWDLIKINPGLVHGPALTKASASMSLSTMKQLTGRTMALGAPSLGPQRVPRAVPRRRNGAGRGVGRH